MRRLWPLVAAIEHLVQHEAAVDSGGRVGVGKQLRLDATALDTAPDMSTFCGITQVDSYTRVGCGTCADSCNEYETKELDGTESTVSSVTSCKEACGQDPDCKAMSIESLGDGTVKCITHTALPYMHGAVCGGQCGGDSATCGVHTCLAREPPAAAAVRVVELGTGACASHDGTDLDVIRTDFVEAAGDDGLAVVRQNCKAKCMEDESCRAYSVGQRACTAAGSASSQHVCQLYSSAAAQAVQHPAGLRLGVCTDDFCPDGACSVPTPGDTPNMKCFAKTHFAADEKEWHMRSEGACIGESWTQSGSLNEPVEAQQEEQLILQNYSHTSKERHCQQQCEGSAECTGVSFTISASTTRSSFCRLYKEAVVAGNARLRQEELCDACKPDNTPCSCLASTGSTIPRATCCAACKACSAQYNSKCYAYGVA